MNLKSDMRQKNTQIKLDFHSALTGETRPVTGGATESRPTIHATESPASTNQLMEEVCERENLKQALQQVKANKEQAGRRVMGSITRFITHGMKVHGKRLPASFMLWLWAGAISRAPPATVSSNTAMLPDEFSPVTRKWPMSGPSRMTSSEGLMRYSAVCWP